jgi:hypothetical protein
MRINETPEDHGSRVIIQTPARLTFARVPSGYDCDQCLGL